MRTLFASVIGALALSLAQPVAAQDYDKGRKAAQRGDFVAALREWKPLAEQGNQVAQYYLGVMYRNGTGLPKDYREAVKWYRKAAEQGFERAQNDLGALYGVGKGVPLDYGEALKWYRKAAEQGFAPAIYNSGVIYAQGEGAPQDNVLAHMWFNLAAARGNKNATKTRDIIGKRMTRADLSLAQRLARECLARNFKNCGR